MSKTLTMLHVFASPCYYCGTHKEGQHMCPRYVLGSRLNQYLKPNPVVRIHFNFCPMCNYNLFSHEDGYDCKGCGWHYNNQNMIPVILPFIVQYSNLEINLEHANQRQNDFNSVQYKRQLVQYKRQLVKYKRQFDRTYLTGFL